MQIITQKRVRPTAHRPDLEKSCTFPGCGKTYCEGALFSFSHSKFCTKHAWFCTGCWAEQEGGSQECAFGLSACAHTWEHATAARDALTATTTPPGTLRGNIMSRPYTFPLGLCDSCRQRPPCSSRSRCMCVEGPGGIRNCPEHYTLDASTVVKFDCASGICMPCQDSRRQKRRLGNNPGTRERRVAILQASHGDVGGAKQHVCPHVRDATPRKVLWHMVRAAFDTWVGRPTGAHLAADAANFSSWNSYFFFVGTEVGLRVNPWGLSQRECAKRMFAYFRGRNKPEWSGMTLTELPWSDPRTYLLLQ